MTNCSIFSGNVEVVCLGLLYDLKIADVVPPGAFRGCRRVRRAVIQAQSQRARSFTGSFINTDSIGENAFKDCVNLESVKFMGTRHTIIGSYAFCDCKRLSSVQFPEDQSDDVMLTIKPFAFHGCSAITYLYIAPGVTSIGAEAFSECGLTEVQIGEPYNKKKDISRRAFDEGVQLVYVEVPMEGMCSIQYRNLKF